MKAQLSPDNVKEYSVEWSDKGGIDAEEHSSYLHTFCEDFYNGVTKLIDSAAASQDDSVKVCYSRWDASVLGLSFPEDLSVLVLTQLIYT